MHVINTTDATQVVKIRLRRGSDSRDALDFNVILSPKDEWTGSIRSDEAGVFVESNDASCTAPAYNEGGNRFRMPETFAEGATEGYIEVIGMAEADASQPIAVAAKHKAGVPANCASVRANFFRVEDIGFGTNTIKGVHNNAVTANGSPALTCPDSATLTAICGVSNYTHTADDALIVSYFSRDADGGLEYGNNAVMIQGFSQDAMMTNQEALLIVDGTPQWDPYNFELPNLDGGPVGTPARGGANTGLYDSVIRPALGATAIYNDWSNNQSDSFSVNTDWVVTIPGQYLMVDPVVFFLAEAAGKEAICKAKVCDARDIPVRANVKFYDREETAFAPEDGDLVVSPATSVSTGTDLPYEVNVIEWSDTAVLDSQYAQSFDVSIAGAANGWAALSVTPSTAKAPQAVWDPNTDGTFTGTLAPVTNINPTTTLSNPPIIGFAVWERNFGNNSAANYGRAVDHSYGSM